MASAGPSSVYNHGSGVFLLPYHTIFTVPATKFLLLPRVIGFTYDNLCDAREPEKQCI
jgi:hypothetical protein